MKAKAAVQCVSVEECEMDPVFIVGAARSGTTLLGQNILASHSSVCYCREPAYIWRSALRYSWHDVWIGDGDGAVTIRRAHMALHQQWDRANGRLLVEKTPANSLRVELLAQAFPRAKFVHVVRDGRDVAISAAEEWKGRGYDALDSRDRRRRGVFGTMRRLGGILMSGKTRRELRSLPSGKSLFALSSRSVRFLLRTVFHVDWFVWGPRFPGISLWRWHLGTLEAAAMQWQMSVSLAGNALQNVDSNRVCVVKYESLVEKPESEISRIGAFLDLQMDSNWLERVAGEIVPTSQKWERGLSKEQRKRLELLIGHVLRAWGYELSFQVKK